jgi:hypothetical protein
VACELDVVLREEIMACQQARADFVRWKLILIAGAGAAGLGVLQANMTAVPLICVYVDAVCLHNDSRIMMIAKFLRESRFVSEAARDYEALCRRNRRRFYSEWVVLVASSAGLSLLVLAVGTAAAYQGAAFTALAVGEPVAWVLIASGVSGLIATGLLIWRHRRMLREDTEDADADPAPATPAAPTN